MNKLMRLFITAIFAILFLALLYSISLNGPFMDTKIAVFLAVLGYIALVVLCYLLLGTGEKKPIQEIRYIAPAQNKAYDCMTDMKDEEKRAEDAYWDQLIAEIEKAPAQKIETDTSSLM